MRFGLIKIDKKSIAEKVEFLKLSRKKVVLLQAEKEIRVDLSGFLKGWLEALIECLELFSLLFEFYPKKFMEKKAQAINENLCDLEKAIEDLK